MSGRPLDLRWPAENVPAILDIWYPGTRGGEAVANLLFGDVSPGGRSPSPGHERWDRYRWCTHTLPFAGATGAPLLGRGQHASVPVRVRPELRPIRYATSASILASHHEWNGHRVGGRHQCRGS